MKRSLDKPEKLIRKENVGKYIFCKKGNVEKFSTKNCTQNENVKML